LSFRDDPVFHQSRPDAIDNVGTSIIHKLVILFAFILKIPKARIRCFITKKHKIASAVHGGGVAVVVVVFGYANHVP
jgi:hypothetical protein